MDILYDFIYNCITYNTVENYLTKYKKNIRTLAHRCTEGEVQ